MRYEYTNYTGKEKWAVVTELTEKELRERYPDIIKRYTPFVLLSIAQGEVIAEYQNYEARERMRNLRFGHIFDINDGEFEEHHSEVFAETKDFVDEWIQKENINEALNKLTQLQKKRVIEYFLLEKTLIEISENEGVSIPTLSESINAAIKKLRKILTTP